MGQFAETMAYINKNKSLLRKRKNMKIAIVGRKKDTVRYEKYFSAIPAQTFTTLSLGELDGCDAVILPGGGDITPAFFGECNKGSSDIDTELDILQIQAVDYCIRHHLPLLGICKGMQVINVALGGTLIQDLPTAGKHKYIENDQHHITRIAPGSFLYELYGKELIVNSAHHQGVGKLGNQLIPIQWCPDDGCVEAIVHETLPIIGFQWHPERLGNAYLPADEVPLQETVSLQPEAASPFLDASCLTVASLRQSSEILRAYFVSLIKASSPSIPGEDELP